MLNQTTMICALFIGFVATILFVYVQQKTSRIEKNIKNVISFIKDIEKRIGENKQEVHQEVSNEFFSSEQNQVEEESEEESEEEQEQEQEHVDVEVSAESESEVEAEAESALDDEIININFKLGDEQENYRKQPVAQLRELVVSLNIDVEDVQKLKKKEIIELLDNHYADSSESGDYNIDI